MWKKEPLMPAEAKRILRNTKLFKHLSDQELDSLYGQAKTVEYKPGNMIVTEGDVGDVLYIILSGSVRIFTFNKDGEEIVLARLESGNYFGEQALLTPTPLRRNASARAFTNVTVLTFSHAVMQHYLQSNKRLLELLQQHGQTQIISKLVKQLHTQEEEQQELFSLFEKVDNYSAEQVIFHQGDKPDFAYFLLSGSVVINFLDEHKQTKFRSQIAPGQFFGEKGVLENKPRAGTAIALDDVQVVAISTSALREGYQENVHLNALLDSLINVYKISTVGLVTQYQGNFLDQPAINTHTVKPNGEVLIASRVINANIFAVSYVNIKETESKFFQDSENHVREIKLADNHLVGVINIGEWGDLQEIYQLVYNKLLITPEILQAFSKSGNLTTPKLVTKIDNPIVCECMQIRQHQIQNMLLHGETLESVTKKTGAGTVCGGCRPKLIDLIGDTQWTFVEITQVRKHNDKIRSYQLKTIDSSMLSYYPGQHIVIEANINGRWIARSYTLTSSANMDKDYYEITVKRETFGLFSQWLFDHAGLGTLLRMSDPQGTFIFDLEQSTATIFFTAGIGITPAIAFAKKIISSGQSHPLHIHHSVHQLEDLAFRDELTNWPKQHHHITIDILNTSQHERLNEYQVREVLTRYPQAEIFICGPVRYQETLTTILQNAGITFEHIHIEQFTHAGEPLTLVH